MRTTAFGERLTSAVESRFWVQPYWQLREDGAGEEVRSAVYGKGHVECILRYRGC